MFLFLRFSFHLRVLKLYVQRIIILNEGIGINSFLIFFTKKKMSHLFYPDASISNDAVQMCLLIRKSPALTASESHCEWLAVLLIRSGLSHRTNTNKSLVATRFGPASSSGFHESMRIYYTRLEMHTVVCVCLSHTLTYIRSVDDLALEIYTCRGCKTVGTFGSSKWVANLQGPFSTRKLLGCRDYALSASPRDVYVHV